MKVKPFLLFFFHLYSVLTNDLSEKIVAYLYSITIDEAKYILTKLLTKQIGETIIEPNIDFYGEEREEIIRRINEELKESQFNSFENFIAGTKLYPPTVSIENILQTATKKKIGFLVQWYINAEKYDRLEKEPRTYIGSVADYAKYLTTNQLIYGINSIISNYQLLQTRPGFDYFILNIKKIDKNAFDYILTKKLEQKIEYIIQIEFFVREVLHETSPIISYTREQLFKINDDEITKILYDLIKKYKQLSNTDYFIRYIEDRNGTYITPQNIINQISNEKDLNQLALGCENYYRRIKDNTKPLRKLEEYVEQIPRVKKINYIYQRFLDFPELTENKRIYDIMENEQYLQYALVKTYFLNKPRDVLIRSYLNIRKWAGEDDSNNLHNDALNSIFRMKNIDINNAITSIASKHIELQKKEFIINVGNLFNGIICNYLSVQPRGRLIELGDKISEFHKDMSNNLTEFTNFNLLPDNDIKTYIQTVSGAHSIVTTEDLRKKVKSIEEVSHLYGDILDFLRALNFKNLRILMINFENYDRKKNHYMNMIGGGQDILRNLKLFNKEKLIEKILKYTSIFPELKNPENFIKVTGTESKFKFLLTTDNLYEKACAFDGYRRRKNNQIIYNEGIWKYYNKDSNKDIYIFFMMKILAMFPELNIKEVREIVYNQIYPGVNYDAFFKTLQNPNILELAKKCQSYYNRVYNAKDRTPLDSMDRAQLIIYINQIRTNSEQLKNDENFARLVYGENEVLYYDNYFTFLERQTDKRLEIILQKINQYYNQKFKGVYFYKPLTTNINELRNMTRNETITEIINKINNISELQQPKIFDEKIDNIDCNEYQTKECEDLKLLHRETLVRFCLMCEILNQEEEEKKQYKIYNDIYVMSKNEIIRYILETLDRYPDITLLKLKLYSESRNLNFGDNSVSDLSEY